MCIRDSFNREKKFGGREMGHRLLNKYLVLMDVGGAVYVLLELAWRGRSHWTMFVLGGLCFIGLGLINEVLPWDMPLSLAAPQIHCLPRFLLAPRFLAANGFHAFLSYVL